LTELRHLTELDAKPERDSEAMRTLVLPVGRLHAKWQAAVAELCRHLHKTLSTQAFYAVGLALQKGLPYLLIPVLVRFYGDHTYAAYVLFYSTTLMFANVLALAMPNSVIVFWHAEPDKQGLAQTYLGLLTLTQAGMSALLTLPLFAVYRRSFGTKQALLFTLCALVFAVFYNVNTFLTGVCRACSYSKSYFNAQVIAALVLAGALAGLRRWPGIEALILAFMLSLAAQNLYLLAAIREYLGKLRRHIDRQLAKRILLYSLALVPHIGVTLFYYWIDKYLVRQFFPARQFSEFVITFQYAFMQSFFAQVLALHAFPLICRLIADEEDAAMRSIVRTYNILFVVLGAGWVGTLLLLQYLGCELRVDTLGMVLLGAGFMVWNIASNYMNVLWARLRAVAVAVISMSAGLLLLIVLEVGCRLQNIGLCYMAHLVCALAATSALVTLSRHCRVVAGRSSAQPMQVSSMTD
jgi:O-antigen/teichoic acid export membrane protein